GYSDDGIIEALEDMHGNILFQDHPEALAIYALDNNLVHRPPHGNGIEEGSEVRTYDYERYRSAMAALLIMEDFLHN
ncbi:MAG: hypothetical protein AB8U72_02205, partial [Anaplasma ovis]